VTGYNYNVSESKYVAVSFFFDSKKTCNVQYINARKCVRHKKIVARNKTVTTVRHCVCFTCLDFLRLLLIKLELLSISNTKKLTTIILGKKKKKSVGGKEVK
jgi:hypothetical protein